MDSTKQETSTTIASTDSELDAAIKKYLPYLREIQRKLITLLIIIVTSGLLGFFYYQKIITFILHLFNLKGITIVMSSPYQFIDLSINTGIATGIIIAFPVLLFYILSFLKPALAPREFGLIARLVPLALVLFVVGFGFGAWVMQFVISMYSQSAIDFNITNIWDISHFLAQTIVMGLCLAFMFEMPVILTFLLKLNLLKKEAIAKNRRYVYAGVILIAALLPPNDIISLSILTLAPLFLFEITLILNK